MKEKTRENSEEQAEVIKSISMLVLALDTDYCLEIVKDMRAQAQRQRSMAVLNPNHPELKNQILDKQASALKSLCDYVNQLKKVEELKKQLAIEELNRQQIAGLFL